MNPSFNYYIHKWTQTLTKVERINLGGYGIAAVTSLRGVVVAHDFLEACVRFWDPEAHVFRIGATWSELCPLFEEFCAIIGCNPDAPLVRNEVKVGNVRLFAKMFGFSLHEANEVIADSEKVSLLKLMDRFREPNHDDLEYMLHRRRAFVFCLTAGFLFNRNPGFGDLSLCPLICQMEAGNCIGGIILAETIRSLDRASLGFANWTVTPIILQVLCDFAVVSPSSSFFTHQRLINRSG